MHYSIPHVSRVTTDSRRARYHLGSGDFSWETPGSTKSRTDRFVPSQRTIFTHWKDLHPPNEKDPLGLFSHNTHRN